MSTHNLFKLENGSTVEIFTNVGASPRVFVNSVYQLPHEAHKYLYLLEQRRWESVIIWCPRKINGRWYWPGTRVYRRRTLSPSGGMWTYGDSFDILKE